MVTLEQTLAGHADAVVALVVEKQIRYGRDNIATTGMLGIAVRLVDKAARLYHLAAHPEVDPGGESLMDTLRDTVGYGLIGLAVEEGRW